MSFTNENQVFCMKCSAFKRSFKMCFDRGHQLVANELNYSEKIWTRVHDIVESNTLLTAINQKYKIGRDLNKLVFVMRFPEKDTIKTPIVRNKLAITSKCPIHKKKALGYCLTCKRNFCFKEYLHFDHQYILYDETAISHEIDKNNVEFSKLEEYQIYTAKFEEFKMSVPFNKTLHSNIIKQISSFIPSAKSESLTEGLIDCLVLFKSSFDKEVEKETEKFKQDLAPYSRWIKRVVIPPDIRLFSNLSKDIYPEGIRIVLDYYKRLFIGISYVNNIINYAYLSPSNMYLSVHDKKINQHLFYSYDIRQGFRVISNTSDANEEYCCFICCDRWSRGLMSYKLGEPVKICHKPFEHEKLAESTHLETIHKLTTMSINTNIENGYCFYFISDGKLIRRNLVNDKYETEMQNNVVIVTYDDEDDETSDEDDEHVKQKAQLTNEFELYSPVEFVKLLTIYNSNIEIIGVDGNNDMYYAMKTIGHTDDASYVKYKWHKFENFGFSHYDKELRYYVGSWIEENKDIAESGLFASNNGLYVYNNNIIKLKSDSIFVLGKFTLVYFAKGRLHVYPIIF